MREDKKPTLPQKPLAPVTTSPPTPTRGQNATVTSMFSPAHEVLSYKWEKNGPVDPDAAASDCQTSLRLQKEKDQPGATGVVPHEL
eukprot:6396550-Amphidinium_carterae.1